MPGYVEHLIRKFLGSHRTVGGRTPFTHAYDIGLPARPC